MPAKFPVNEHVLYQGKKYAVHRNKFVGESWRYDLVSLPLGAHLVDNVMEGQLDICTVGTLRDRLQHWLEEDASIDGDEHIGFGVVTSGQLADQLLATFDIKFKGDE